ncbi:multisubunit Na+/H+ antiporter, MnhE subunit [Saccharomonospora marina XMU15]|uniref:Multisubunit Na+/H+ antiporter, MnhE subunit n=1 Tax=Saccharomonospora marina XMU15 TaxID=882083 RepID=H5WWQ6_9PSEU|nr:Na+/H+ antiporter subunit E [Saccharomonospora marina]EHR51669.1 multisubunit Na+/H+ antiporter, MnhE subunit [Saccharomonospora marina XMU15]
MRRLSGRLSLALFGWLLGVWLLLWGSVAPGTVLTGLLVAASVLLLFPLPTRSLPLLRPVRLLILVVFVVVDVTESAVRLALEILRSGPGVRSAVVAVPSLSDVDHVVAACAGVISLTPNTFVLQIDREGGVLYVYSLGVRTKRQADRAHDQAIQLQVRVVLAIAPAEEARDVRERAATVRRVGPISPEKTPEEDS